MFLYFFWLTSHTHMNTLQITHDLFHYFFCCWISQPSFLTSRFLEQKLLPCGCWWFCWYLCYMLKRLELCVFGVVIIIFGLSRFPQRVMNTFGMGFFSILFAFIRKSFFVLFIFESAFKVLLFWWNTFFKRTLLDCSHKSRNMIVCYIHFHPFHLECLSHKYSMFVIRYIDISRFSLQWTDLKDIKIHRLWDLFFFQHHFSPFFNQNKTEIKTTTNSII